MLKSLALLVGNLLATNLLKLGTADNYRSCHAEPVVIFSKLPLHLVQKWFIRKLYFPSQGITEELATELPHHIVPPGAQEVVPQALDTVDICPVKELGAGIHRLGPEPSNRIVLLQGKAIGIDLGMAPGTCLHAAVKFDKLPGRFVSGHDFRQDRHIGRRLGTGGKSALGIAFFALSRLCRRADPDVRGARGVEADEKSVRLQGR